jgi:hypothetical protein
MDSMSTVWKISLRKGRTRLRWVSQLMTSGRREWDEQILQTCFYNHDIDEIKKIRLSDRLEDDVVAWHFEKSGVFSVRSAYRISLQQEQESMDEPGSSMSLCSKGFGKLGFHPKFRFLLGDYPRMPWPRNVIERNES